MIRISLGNIGSGKTACEVRNMFFSPIPVLSNIRTTLKHAKLLDFSMIIKKESQGTGSEKKSKNKALNIEFWKSLKKPVNVVLDEAHAIINSRRAMSKNNIIFTEWLALLRRMLGTSDYSGDLVLITQLDNRIDIIARNMAHQVRYHICYYSKMCKKCKIEWRETSEMPEPIQKCPKCDNWSLKRYDFRIEVYHFSSMEAFQGWKYMGIRSYYKRYIVNDIEAFFPCYDTLQWDNLFEN